MASKFPRFVTHPVPNPAPIAATFPQQIPGLIRWSADNRSFDIISNVTIGTLTTHVDNDGRETLYNAFPAIKRWKLDGINQK